MASEASLQALLVCKTTCFTDYRGTIGKFRAAVFSNRGTIQKNRAAIFSNRDGCIGCIGCTRCNLFLLTLPIVTTWVLLFTGDASPKSGVRQRRHTRFLFCSLCWYGLPDTTAHSYRDNRCLYMISCLFMWKLIYSCQPFWQKEIVNTIAIISMGYQVVL